MVMTLNMTMMITAMMMMMMMMGSMGGVAVIPLVYHYCGPGLIPWCHM
jgi:hypothetical protein